MTSQLLINEPPLQVLPTLAFKIGLNEAIILQQIHYWLNPQINKKCIEGRYWVYNSCESWQQQFKFWSKNTIRRAIVSLQTQRLLIIRNFNHDKFNHSKWYSIDYEQLQLLETWANRFTQNGFIDETKMGKSINSNCTNRSDQNGSIEEPNLGKSLTETTSRDYTETTHTAGEKVLGPSQNLYSLSGEELSQPSSQHPAMMLALWNDAIRKPESPLALTFERKAVLAKSLKQSFDGNLDTWNAYCNRISKLPFLMGQGERGWKVSLEWALEPDHIRKVLEGNYQQNNIPISQVVPVTSPVIDFTAVHPQWAKVCKFLIQSLGVPKFNSWFANLVPEQLDTSSPVLRAPSLFVKEWIERLYLKDLEHAFRHLDGNIKSVSIVHKPGEKE
ncbi:MAG: hypothetical protein IBJ00_01495 [Alphaproteobacteria bacterium]|nr:hypothetical protein [Alphaproteobacteria bacterium]